MKSIGGKLSLLAILIASYATVIHAQDPLPSWNDGSAKQAIVDFVKTTTESGGANFVPPEERIATLLTQDALLLGRAPGVFAVDVLPGPCAGCCGGQTGIEKR